MLVLDYHLIDSSPCAFTVTTSDTVLSIEFTGYKGWPDWRVMKAYTPVYSYLYGKSDEWIFYYSYSTDSSWVYIDPEDKRYEISNTPCFNIESIVSTLELPEYIEPEDSMIVFSMVDSQRLYSYAAPGRYDVLDHDEYSIRVVDAAGEILHVPPTCTGGVQDIIVTEEY